jgi:histidine triad (HIT) family protein
MPVKGLGEYDPNNIFARILRDEIPSKRVFENEYAVAFHDIAPQAPVHVLIVPRGPYISLADFAVRASEAEIAGFFRAVAQVARELNLEESGYRTLSNMGEDGGQEVPHFHVHLFGGRRLGAMLKRDAG